ncbi:S8 family serine peptidase [Alisedimentitalea sp. MJ-SS2]|uniref:S8 family serine peptidase n=1 Tax=Aliisedimentitalea sp. MJ-SS2 TaxID=3049795 RepID=UPI002907434C|nr:S8 family serine peptidase [Alisedimentitalea sp. MJ-SS2]MDU8928211.1 S8 family serine peptidase [Alisedimentitalea sp. MJ-SS2]
MMLSWRNTPDVNVLDPVTDFRLSMPDSHFPSDPVETWWSVLIEIENTSIDKFEAALSEHASDLLIPVAYDATDRAKVRLLQPVTIFARKALIDVLNQIENPYGVVSLRLGAVTPERFLDHDATSSSMKRVTVSDDAVVMAVIDDGIAIAHDLLRKDRTETRVEHATIFEADPRKIDSHCSIGRALNREDINGILRDCTHNGLLNEESFYAQSGQVDLKAQVVSTVAQRVSHGTHVAAIAASQPMQHADDKRPVICAVLPSRVVEDTTGLDLLPILYLAFHILSKQAGRFHIHNKGPAPVVFNFSFGNTGGPHDGTGLFAGMFDHFFGVDSDMAKRGQKAWITLPVGNSNLGRMHAEASDGTADMALDLMVQPDDHTPSNIQVWLPTSAEDNQPDFATVHVTVPGSGQRGAIQTQPGQSVSLTNDAGEEIARLAYQYIGGRTKRGLVTLTLSPTADLDRDPVLAPAGLWQLEIVRNDGAPDGVIHAWVRRDETLPGSRSGGRQAYFDDLGYVRFDRFGAPLATDPPASDCPVRRAGTLSGFACGPEPIVVAGYSEREAELSGYSSAGPLNPRGEAPGLDREGPDLAAKSDDSYLLRGVFSAGSRSGSWVRLSGTSVASPRVARAAADGIHDGSGDGRGWSHAAAKRHPFDLDPDTERSRAGAGGITIPIWSER